MQWLLNGTCGTVLSCLHQCFCTWRESLLKATAAAEKLLDMWLLISYLCMQAALIKSKVMKLNTSVQSLILFWQLLQSCSSSSSNNDRPTTIICLTWLGCDSFVASGHLYHSNNGQHDVIRCTYDFDRCHVDRPVHQSYTLTATSSVHMYGLFW